MRSGSSAQVKKLIQQKQRVKQTKAQVVNPFNALTFNAFIRTRWVLTKRNTLPSIDFYTGEFLIVTLLEEVTPSCTGRQTSTLLDLSAILTRVLASQEYMRWQYFVRLASILPVVIKFLTKEFAASPYFTLANIPDKNQTMKLIANILASHLSVSQGMGERLQSEYTTMFYQAEKLQLAVIAELFRGIEPVKLAPEIETPMIEVHDNDIDWSTQINEYTDTQAIREFLTAILAEWTKIQRLSDLLLGLIPTTWQPTSEIFGWGHQLATFCQFLSDSKLVTISGDIDWNSVDRIIAVNNLNYQLQNH